MATVRLHTQHHSAGGLRPATPTCCCCSCCCVGSTVGTLAVLPVMVALGGVAPRPEPAAPPPPDPGESFSHQYRARPARRFGIREWGAGLLALALALAPVLIGWIVLATGGEYPNLTLILVAFVATFIGLATWAAIRANRAGRPTWPPLVVTFALLPFAVVVEFFFGGPMTSGHDSSYGWLALAIGAAIFGLGVWSSWGARRS